ncbi:MAG: SDR family NAD(P)-dependent oxidoreductase [Acidimicrobiia bacterium]
MFADLTGKTALITGAGSGIGRGIARALAEQGARLAITDVNPDWAAQVKSELSPDTMDLALDVTDPSSVGAAIYTVLERWGTLEILVNNAGVAADPKRTTPGDREEDWDRTFAVNVKGTVHCCDALVPHMRERRSGRIINIASMAGHAARGTGGAYAASKAAVLRYTKGLARPLSQYQITVNAICPGAVWETRFQEGEVEALRRHNPTLSDLDDYQVFWSQYENVIPMGRPQTPEDIGKLAAFLASDDARNITGQCIHVDGGALLRD